MSVSAVASYEPVIRLSAFGAVLVIMMVWELLSPWRPHRLGRLRRWPNNLGVTVVNVAVLRLVFPISAVAFAMLVQERGWGLFSKVVAPTWLEAVASVVILDLAIYGQHVLVHAIPLLWRLHRMHHADLEIDVTTGIRFHPIEIGLSMVVKFALIAALGIPPVAVLIFEIALNATSLFTHGNVKMPSAVDGVLRRFVVTPDMHRVHHSIVPGETNSNYGFNLPWWDHLFGTYRAAPAAGFDGMTIGIPQFRAARELRLDRMLLQPLRNDNG